MDRKAEQIVNVDEGSHVGTVTQIMRFGIPTIVILAVLLIAIAAVSGYNLRTIFEPIFSTKLNAPVRLDLSTGPLSGPPDRGSIELGNPEIAQEDLLNAVRNDASIGISTESNILDNLEYVGRECENINLAVTSLVEDEWIRIERYPLVEVRPFQENKYSIYQRRNANEVLFQTWLAFQAGF